MRHGNENETQVFVVWENETWKHEKVWYGGIKIGKDRPQGNKNESWNNMVWGMGMRHVCMNCGTCYVT